MALEINNNVIDLTKQNQQTKEIKSQFAELTERFKLDKKRKAIILFHPSFIKENPQARFASPDKPVRKIFRPKSLNIEFLTVIPTNLGIETVRYYESKTPVPNTPNVFKYEPTEVIVENALTLGLKNIELLWFLYFKYPLIEGGVGRDKSRPALFEFQDAEGVAKKSVGKIRQHALVDSKITFTEEEGGLPEDAIRRLGASLYIANAMSKDMALDILRDQISKLVKTDTNAMEVFKEVIEAGDTTILNVKASIQEAIDLDVIKLVEKKGVFTWHYLDKKLEPQKALCRVVGAIKPNEALYRHLLNNPEVLEDFKELIETNRE